MKYFKILLSRGDEIKIDEDDYNKFINNTDNFIQLKKGVVNPSFVVSITPISQREVMETESNKVIESGYVDEKTNIFKVTKIKDIVDSKLKDEFHYK